MDSKADVKREIRKRLGCSLQESVRLYNHFLIAGTRRHEYKLAALTGILSAGDHRLDAIPKTVNHIADEMLLYDFQVEKKQEAVQRANGSVQDPLVCKYMSLNGSERCMNAQSRYFDNECIGLDLCGLACKVHVKDRKGGSDE